MVHTLARYSLVCGIQYSRVHREGMFRTTLLVRCSSSHNKARKGGRRRYRTYALRGRPMLRVQDQKTGCEKVKEVGKFQPDRALLSRTDLRLAAVRTGGNSMWTGGGGLVKVKDGWEPFGSTGWNPTRHEVKGVEKRRGSHESPPVASQNCSQYFWMILDVCW